MKTERNSMDGQLDIFEAMNRAAEAVDRMVARPKQNKKLEKQELEEPANKQKHIIRGCDMHASMRRTFINPADDDFAMVAYIDYNMVYLRDWNAPAALHKFENSKDAVEYYVSELGRIRDTANAEMTKENEPFSDVKYVVENLYAECE